MERSTLKAHCPLWLGFSDYNLTTLIENASYLPPRDALWNSLDWALWTFTSTQSPLWCIASTSSVLIMASTSVRVYLLRSWLYYTKICICIVCKCFTCKAYVLCSVYTKKTLEKTERVTGNGQSKDTGNTKKMNNMEHLWVNTGTHNG